MTTESATNGNVDPNDQRKQQESSKVTGFQLMIAALVLGSSAGMTLYTKKTSSMLTSLNRVPNVMRQHKPLVYGPATKAEWEKMRPRFDKDEFF